LSSRGKLVIGKRSALV